MRAAFFAEADLCAGLRLRAAARACLKSASLDAAAPLSRLSAFSVARFRDGLAPFSAFLRSCFAFFRVSSGTLPFSGTGNFTPARLASERPMAIACFGRTRPMLPLADRLDFLADELPRLGGSRFPFPPVTSRTLDAFSFRHDGTQIVFADDPSNARIRANKSKRTRFAARAHETGIGCRVYNQPLTVQFAVFASSDGGLQSAFLVIEHRR